jgi:hypothetical protein
MELPCSLGTIYLVGMAIRWLYSRDGEIITSPASYTKYYKTIIVLEINQFICSIVPIYIPILHTRQ